jgi:serine/threonine-protein kinase
MSEPALSEEPKSARVPKSSGVSPGQIIGDRYRVDEPIGEGGMGVVCRATHVGLETPVAIKLIRPDFKDDEEFVRRFLNEARRAALLKSDRVTRVHDVGQLESGEPYLVMELLEGVELEKYLEQHGRLSALDAVNVALQICEALAEAHAAGIVHRDIKPSNAFLVRRADGRFAVKILDFGISKQLDATTVTSLTNHDQSLGSPHYMSPEQMLDPSNVDHRSDIWSVGVVLFELLSGQRPFDGSSMPEVCAKVLTTPAPALRSVCPEVDRELEASVTRCLEKNPDARFHDVSALGQALQRFACIHASGDQHVIETTAFFEPVVDVMPDDLGSLPPLARPSAPPPARRGRRVHWAGALGVAAAVALTLVAFGRASVVASGGAPVVLAWPWRAAAALDDGPVAAPIDARWSRTYGLDVAADSARAEPERPRDRTAAAASASGAASSPGLSPGEIRHRIERYQRWLDEQGLMRLDSVEDEPDYMKE